MVVAFPRSYGAHIARNSPTAHIASSKLGIVVHVPSSAHSGRIMIVLGHGRHSNSYGPIQVVNHALHPPAPPPAPSTPPSTTPSGSAFDGQGMWIWYVSQSDGGNLAAIVAQAHRPVVGPVGVQPHHLLGLHRGDHAFDGKPRQVGRLQRLDVLDAVANAGGGGPSSAPPGAGRASAR